MREKDTHHDENFYVGMGEKVRHQQSACACSAKPKGMDTYAHLLSEANLFMVQDAPHDFLFSLLPYSLGVLKNHPIRVSFQEHLDSPALQASRLPEADTA